MATINFIGSLLRAIATTADLKQDRIDGIASEQGLKQGPLVEDISTEAGNTPGPGELRRSAHPNHWGILLDSKPKTIAFGWIASFMLRPEKRGLR